MIPKIIHYCWFGGSPLPPDVEAYISSWEKVCPNYKIIQWDETNFDVNSVLFVKQAYENKRWAFVSDYVRLKALFEYGGIYLDTDVEVIKQFDDLLNNNLFFCAESSYSICTSTIGAEKGSEFIKKLISIYDQRVFFDGEKEDKTPNSRFIYDLIHEQDNYSICDSIFRTELYTIFPSEYFSPINCYNLKSNISRNTYCIHWYKGSWKTKTERIKDILLAFLTRLLGESFREKIKIILKRIK